MKIQCHTTPCKYTGCYISNYMSRRSSMATENTHCGFLELNRGVGAKTAHVGHMRTSALHKWDRNNYRSISSKDGQYMNPKRRVLAVLCYRAVVNIQFTREHRMRTVRLDMETYMLIEPLAASWCRARSLHSVK